MPSAARNLALISLPVPDLAHSEILRRTQDDSEGLGMTLHSLWMPVSRRASTAVLDEYRVGAGARCAHAAARPPL